MCLSVARRSPFGRWRTRLSAGHGRSTSSTCIPRSAAWYGLASRTCLRDAPTSTEAHWIGVRIRRDQVDTVKVMRLEVLPPVLVILLGRSVRPRRLVEVAAAMHSTRWLQCCVRASSN